MEERTYWTAMSAIIVVIGVIAANMTLNGVEELGAKKYHNCLAATNGNAEWCMKNL